MRKEANNKKHSVRKTFVLLTVLATMVLTMKPMMVCSQVFLWDEETGSYRAGMSESEFNIVPYQGGDADQYFTPLGEGLLLLGGLGVAYGFAKRKKSKR